MVLRAKDSFWWPGLTNDIEQVRALCNYCHSNAPSQAKEPSGGTPVTSFAYKMICCVNLILKENEFLAIVDRHSGMLSIHLTNYSGSRGFLKILREHIQKWGIPLEVSTDRASIYMSQETQDFYKKYGIKHRV